MHADNELVVSDDVLAEMEARGLHDVRCPHCESEIQRKTGEIWKCTHCGEIYRVKLGERDPRVDPQPGDILVVDRDQREVLDRVQDSIEYGFPNRAASRWLPLIRWQVWARNADVKKVAP